MNAETQFATIEGGFRITVLILVLCFCSLITTGSALADDQLEGIGVSLAGPEFGGRTEGFCNLTPGTVDVDYVFPNEDTIQFFASHEADFLRLPIRWERLQLQPGGPLNESYLKHILVFCDFAQKHNISVLVDLHNYGRYRLKVNGEVQSIVIDQLVDGKIPVSREHLADFWRRLAARLTFHKAVIGYGLMNEPHDMGDSDWKKISQAAVDSIRTVDRKTTIVVAGDEWSSAINFERANGADAWITDSIGPIVYEAHLYFDSDTSGEYKHSFAAEAKLDRDFDNRAIHRISPFLQWCTKNSVRGIVGEVGCPADLRWKTHFQSSVSKCMKNNVSVCYWAAGPWWDNYPLSIQPQNNQPAPQWRWLLESKRQTNIKLTHKLVDKP